jgi:hypothetical protein
MTETHLNPRIDSSTRSYVGRVYYNINGEVIEHVGHEVEKIANEKIEASNLRLRGKWSFCLLKTMKISGSARVWETAILFPDGKIRKLVPDEISVEAVKSKGTWIYYEQVKELFPETRLAQDSRFPWREGFVTTQVMKFDSIFEMEKWVRSNVNKSSVLFVANSPKSLLPPDEEAFFMRCAIVGK